MVFQGQKNTPLTGVLTTFANTFNCPVTGFAFRMTAGYGTRKYSYARRSELYGIVDPCFYMRYLFLSFRAGRETEVVLIW